MDADDVNVSAPSSAVNDALSIAAYDEPPAPANAADAADNAVRNDVLATASCGRDRAPKNVGTAAAIKTANTSTTTINSTSVKPRSGRAA